jgi:hypothetical protein
MSQINNPFQTNPTDTLYIFNQLSKTIQLNGTEDRAILTHSSLNTSFDDYKITSLKHLQRGDVILYNNKKYLIISEVNDTRRSGKYRAIMRLLPFYVHVQTGTERKITGHRSNGDPIYEETPIYSDFDCYVQNQPQMNVNSGGTFNFLEGQFYIVTYDNAESQKVIVNNVFTLNDYNWHVDFIDTSKTGLRIFKVSVTDSEA